MRWLIAFFTFALVAMQLELWFGDDRREQLAAHEAAVAAQSARNQSLIERNADLRAEIVSLRESNEAVEERARAELGLVHESETYYQVNVVESSGDE